MSPAEAGEAGARGPGAAERPDPLQHGQPARQRASRPRSTSPAHLEAAGFECELLGAEPERPNLVARLRGRQADGPTLCYLGHVDTVLANPAEWTHDPWSGEIADGFLWGRGALDMKSQVAAEIAAGASLARSGWRPARGELLIVAVVDEETGGALGAQWITENHPEKVRCDLLVNEGGGAFFEYGGQRCYGVCCAEKGVFRFTVATDGVAGHASMPGMGDNALLKMAPLLERFAARQPCYRRPPSRSPSSRGSARTPTTSAGALARLAKPDRRLGIMFEPMFGVTFTPTRISASEKINVIPSRAELKVDCRVPPGLGEEEVLADIREVLGPARGGRLETRVHREGRGQPLADRQRADGRDLRLGRRARPRSADRSRGAPGLHRLAPLPARLPRLRGLRLLSPAPPVDARVRPADPRRRRAHRRPRPDLRHGALPRPGAGSSWAEPVTPRQRGPQPA